MKTFKENAMMQEMNLQEMKDVNGGFPWGLALKVGEGILVAVGLADAGERFMSGWNSAGDSLEFK